MTKARGRSRFIRREIVFGLLIWLFVVPLMDLFGDRWHSMSARQHILIWLIMLFISLLGGYLTGNWRWKELDEKYPE